MKQQINLKADLIQLKQLLVKIQTETDGAELENCPVLLADLIEPSLSLKDINISKLDNIIKML